MFDVTWESNERMLQNQNSGTVLCRLSITVCVLSCAHINYEVKRIALIYMKQYVLSSTFGGLVIILMSTLRLKPVQMF